MYVHGDREDEAVKTNEKGNQRTKKNKDKKMTSLLF